jgi:hypothetical protein
MHMIVYGDPSYETPAGVLLDRLRQRVEHSDQEDVDERRALLIEAGQLEQALADRLDGDPAARRVETVTELAADALLGHADAGPIREALARIDLPPDLTVRVKVPEGFAFYTLYPEHYAKAAAWWVKDHAAAASRRAVVVGVRSIGTSLSAVVARVLAQAGWTVRRLTVRPMGHPYDRRVELPHETANTVKKTDFGLVVDEGPGQSGSSMAAAAGALVRAGLDRSAIAFFPGHAHGPGHAASDAVRAWWADTPSYVAGLSELAFEGKSLTEALAFHSGGIVVRVEDLSAGAWRSIAYPDERDWPAAFVPFERTRYRAVRRDGSSVLWTFAGLASGAEASLARLEALARGGWTVAPLDCACGFVARPWVEGKPLALEQSDAAVLGHIGRYIAATAGPAMTMAEQQASLERLREMLYWNTWESLGEAMAERTRRWNGLAPERSWPAYGDGWLAPQAWVRRTDGRLIKVDCAGHSMDHTMVGSQPLAWDLAGAMVEWNLDGQTAHGEAASPLLKAFVAAGGEMLPVEALAFYRMAYAAFRLGQCVLCAGTGDAAERRRLACAGEFYKVQLARQLAQ